MTVRSNEHQRVDDVSTQFLSTDYGADLAQWLCNGPSRNDPGFDSRWGRCKNRAPCPSQGTVIGALSLNDPICRWDVKHN